MVSSVTSLNSTDDMLEKEKFKVKFNYEKKMLKGKIQYSLILIFFYSKELQYKINETNKTNVELVNENISLKNTIEVSF